MKILFFFHYCVLSLFFATYSFASTLFLLDESNTPVFQCPLKEGNCFAIRFIHSVAKSPVEEWFCVEKKHMILQKTVYHDFGAGLPYKPEQKQQMRFENSHIVIDNFHRQMDKFTLRVGRIAKHTLLLPKELAYNVDGEEKKIDLDKLTKPGKPLTFTLKRE